MLDLSLLGVLCQAGHVCFCAGSVSAESVSAGHSLSGWGMFLFLGGGRALFIRGDRICQKQDGRQTSSNDETKPCVVVHAYAHICAWGRAHMYMQQYKHTSMSILIHAYMYVLLTCTSTHVCVVCARKYVSFGIDH